MVQIIGLLFGSFLILQAHGTRTQRAGCNGDPNAETGCDTCNTNCDNYDIEPKICSKRACRQDECKCIEDFVKNSKGLCIPYEKCPPACGNHEEYSACNGHCQKTCENKNPICTKVCIPGCVCQPTYVWDTKTRECIKEEQCPRIKCEVNEIATECLPGCPEDTCEMAGKKKSVCNTLLPVSCKAGCICQANYFRNADGVCTSAADCLKCRKQNEVFCCRRPCDDKKCETLGKKCNILYRTCRKQCYCRKGFARNRCGLCIPISKCPKKRKCGRNEVFACHITCPPKTCRAMVERIVCPQPNPCRKQCDCQDNYSRNDDGICIPSKQCFPSLKKRKCGRNEVFACHITCPPKTCRAMVERIVCPQPNPCRKQCDCQDNYSRNDDGICIPSKQCFPSLSEPNIDNASTPNETVQTSESDTGDAPPPANDDEDQYDD